MQLLQPCIVAFVDNLLHHRMVGFRRNNVAARTGSAKETAMTSNDSFEADPLPTIEQLTPNLSGIGIEVPRAARVGAFGDSPEQSRQLLDLVRSGRKRAGAALLWTYQAEGEPIPQVGEVEVVVDHLNRPNVVTRMTQVEVVPFNLVGARFAAREGEGDRSLEYWRKEHWASSRVSVSA